MGTGKTQVADRKMCWLLFHFYSILYYHNVNTRLHEKNIILKIKRNILYVYAHTHISQKKRKKKEKKVQGCCTEVWKVGFGTGRSEP